MDSWIGFRSGSLQLVGRTGTSAAFEPQGPANEAGPALTLMLNPNLLGVTFTCVSLIKFSDSTLLNLLLLYSHGLGLKWSKCLVATGGMCVEAAHDTQKSNRRKETWSSKCNSVQYVNEWLCVYDFSLKIGNPNAFVPKDLCIQSQRFFPQNIQKYGQVHGTRFFIFLVLTNFDHQTSFKHWKKTRFAEALTSIMLLFPRLLIWSGLVGYAAIYGAHDVGKPQLMDLV